MRAMSKALGHIGARGTAYWNVRLLDHLFDFGEIRVHSRRAKSRDVFAERRSRNLGNSADGNVGLAKLRPGRRYRGRDLAPCGARADAEDAVDQERGLSGALWHHECRRALADTSWRSSSSMIGASVRAASSGRCAPMSRPAISRSGRCMRDGRDRLRPQTGREREDETILLWRRGLSLSDIALGRAILEKGKRLGIGQRLPLPESCRATTAAARDRAGTICPALPSRHRGSIWRCPEGH
jgi:alanine dehydrogenase